MTQQSKAFTIKELLRPHWKQLAFGIVAIIGETVADLLEPWPLKIVFDSVLKARQVHGWLNRVVLSVAGTDKLSILKFAAVAVLVIAVLGAICSYIEKYITTSVGQWVMHDLRRRVYSHIQRLSLAYHDQKRTGDLISRVTSDIDSMQSFIASGLLSAMINVLTLLGMVGVMFYINWRFTLIALQRRARAWFSWFSPTRAASRKPLAMCARRKARSFPLIQEVLSSIRVVRPSAARIMNSAAWKTRASRVSRWRSRRAA